MAGEPASTPMAALGEPLRAGVACFDFGGTAVAVESDSPAFLELVRQRYAAFATGDPPRRRLVHRLAGGRTPSPERLFEGRQEPLRSRREGDRLSAWSPSFRLDLDAGQKTARLTGPLATFPVDRFIQILVYETSQRVLIVHGAALADAGRAWLAGGPSGSGKSTLAGLLPEYALCDEFTALDLDGGRPRLAALPFWRARRGSGRLSGIYLLRHGERDRRRRLRGGEAFARLRREILWPTFDPGALERAFEALGELIQAVPVWELDFRPHRDVWRLIRREAGA